ncbi:unnamed protein product [Didymodactylos carnosus]|uniref:MULE transposase domain-containing protein n=1 Tax=Didymodactylos carnosus TaxID=1234261 RepID=A0A815YV89_9BILA|nr:unnamed protein product [Didymodactylos carnosus]CAF4440169.1 unnamed protein product [Didymodactylos carnosus]
MSILNSFGHRFDLYRHFCPIGVCFISTDESVETFKTLFRGIQVSIKLGVFRNNNALYKAEQLSYVMADGAPHVTSAMLELPSARRLCWAHVIRKR